MNSLKISLFQQNIHWEDKATNLEHCHLHIKDLSGKSDLIVLPEMFTTGFSMNSKDLAENIDGITIQTIRKWAVDYAIAISGSFLSYDETGQFYNRGFFITPEGDAFYYDKRHLFRMRSENEVYTAGTEPLIVNYKGWNIRLIICYDLRFPVWTRNVDNAYDLLICCANWPESRVMVWDILLKARAIENQCYVCGVNRVGKDSSQTPHNGNFQLISPRGEVILQCQPDREEIQTVTISKDFLEENRSKFPVWKDADRFIILPE